jgi:hypothetical protein
MPARTGMGAASGAFNASSAAGPRSFWRRISYRVDHKVFEPSVKRGNSVKRRKNEALYPYPSLYPVILYGDKPFLRSREITPEHECSAFTYEERASDQMRTNENTR